jgi:general secretion pathway protein J
MIHRQVSRGFTLFELLVATAILTIITTMAYAGLIQVKNTKQKISVSEGRLTELQLAFLNLERDLQQVVDRPIRNLYGTERPAIAGQGEYLLELTRGGLRNPAHVARSSLQRVAYMIEDDNLVRLYWRVLDQAQDSVPVKQTIVKNVASIEIRYLQGNTWSTTWPPVSAPVAGAAPLPGGFPRAVAVKLELQDVGNIERIFLLPEA